jgi:hypothetical protein
MPSKYHELRNVLIGLQREAVSMVQGTKNLLREAKEMLAWVDLKTEKDPNAVSLKSEEARRLPQKLRESLPYLERKIEHEEAHLLKIKETLAAMTSRGGYEQRQGELNVIVVQLTREHIEHQELPEELRGFAKAELQLKKLEERLDALQSIVDQKGSHQAGEN